MWSSRLRIGIESWAPSGPAKRLCGTRSLGQEVPDAQGMESLARKCHRADLSRDILALLEVLANGSGAAGNDMNPPASLDGSGQPEYMNDAFNALLGNVLSDMPDYGANLYGWVSPPTWSSGPWLTWAQSILFRSARASKRGQ